MKFHNINISNYPRTIFKDNVLFKFNRHIEVVERIKMIIQDHIEEIYWYKNISKKIQSSALKSLKNNHA